MADLDLSDDSMCFCCGSRNPDGLGLRFSYDGEEVSTTVSFPKRFQGYRDIVHGGLLSTVLDEVMVTLLIKMGRLAATAELHVRFRKPLRIGEPIKVRAWLVEERGRVFKLAAAACLLDGTEVASAESTCVSVGHTDPDRSA
jgi:acyl-coenzyme A thioesterase PaaI-like protein